jgi:TolA-binding protein
MDLHPEDLLEREAFGDLAPGERSRLEVHLRHCPACRLERRARTDFAPSAEGPDPDVRALVARALMPGQALMPRSRARRRTARLRAALAAVALLTMCGLAAAASGWSLRRTPRVEAPRTVAAASRALAKGAPGGNAPERPLEGAAGRGGEPPLAIASNAPIEPEVAASAAAVDGAPGPRRPTVSPVAPSPTSTGAPEDAASLFGGANAARRRGEHEDAAATYRRLIARYPRSVEARESVELLGRMLLDDGATLEALRCFDAYASAPGGLAAEAMLGRALALQRLGREDDERAAWLALIDAYPDSLHADRARRRLAALGR